MNTLPSAHQLGDKANLQYGRTAPLECTVIGIHFYPGKVKYDLQINFIRDEETEKFGTLTLDEHSRLYNIDAFYVN